MVGTDVLKKLRVLEDIVSYSLVEVDGNEKLTLVFPSKRYLDIRSEIIQGNKYNTQLKFYSFFDEGKDEISK